MSTYIRPFSEVSAAIAYASSVNRYVDDFASTVNALNSQNLVASAVGATQIETSAVVTAKIDANAVTANKIDGEVLFLQEVFR